MKVNIYFLIFCAVVFIKILLVVFLKVSGAYEIFNGGNDANYYDSYAQGNESVASNIWPIILSGLNDFKLYSRQAISYIFIFLSALVIPICIAKLCRVKSYVNGSLFWGVAILISFYPTIFYYSLDIYRDVFMVYVFVVGLLFVRAYTERKKLADKLVPFLAILLVGVLLYFLRPYLGFAFLCSVFLYGIFYFKRWPMLMSFAVYLLSINLLFLVGAFDPLLTYREFFLETDAGSDLGIVFSSAVTFLPSFIKSFSYQMLGLYFSGIPTIVVFLVESMPFIVMLTYLIINRKFSTRFVDFLVVFFIIYSTIWLLGNDNLGTAVRLRLYSYISIIIASVIVFQEKKSFRLAPNYQNTEKHI